MKNLDLFELQLLPYFKLNEVIFRELKRPVVNFHNVELFFDIMKVDIEIKDNENDNSPLHYATMYNNVALIEYLLERGADINLQNKFGQSPLHYACMLLCEDSIQLLLNNGANVNLVDVNAENPLMLYIREGKNKSIIEMLIDSGVDLEHTDYNGKTSIEIAIQYKNEQAISLLAKYTEVPKNYPKENF